MKRIMIFIFLSLVFCLSSCSQTSKIPQDVRGNLSVTTLTSETPCEETVSLISAHSALSEFCEIREYVTDTAKVYYPYFNSEMLDSQVLKQIEDYFAQKKSSGTYETYDFSLSQRQGSRSLIFYDSASASSSLLHRFSITFNEDYSKTLSITDFISSSDPLVHIEETVDTLYAGNGAFHTNELPDFYVKEDGIVVIDSLDNQFFIPDKYFFARPSHKVTVDDSYAPVTDKNEKVLALTFDDGPNYYTTSSLLSMLKEKGVKATFFMVGYNIPGNEFLVRRMINQGCDIGIHSYAHQNYDLMTHDEIMEDIHKCSELIRNACGIDPYLVRPPFGNITEEIVSEKEYFYINWCVDPYDWQNNSAETIAEHIINYSHSGDIVLLHDLYERSIDAAEIVIDKLSEDGWRFVTISELFSLKDKTPSGNIYYGLGK